MMEPDAALVPAAATDDDNLRREQAFSIIRGALRPGDRVLDVGCGYGQAGAFLAKAGATVDGLEPDPARAEAARLHLNRVWTAPLEDPPDEIGQYDVVTMLDVLEHLVEPVEGLVELKRFLTPNGRAYLFVPNSAHWSFRLKILRGDWSYHDWGLFDRTHLRFFDPSTAAAACRAVPFDEHARWYTSPHTGRLTRVGLRIAPALFALHVLFELRMPR